MGADLKDVAFDVPGWLHWWWDIWVPFTAAIHWPAWAAIFTFFALLNVARLADRTRIEGRLQQAVYLYGAAETLAAYSRVVRGALGQLESPEMDDEKKRARLRTLNVALEKTDTVTVIKGLDIHAMPTPGTMQALRSAKINVAAVQRNIERFVVEERQLKPERALENLDRMDKRKRELIAEAHRREWTLSSWAWRRCKSLAKSAASVPRKLSAE